MAATPRESKTILQILGSCCGALHTIERTQMQTPTSDHSASYLAAAADLARAIDPARLDAMARGLAEVREPGGRLFILGVGGGAGHASHAVNDFRKLCRSRATPRPTTSPSSPRAPTTKAGRPRSAAGWRSPASAHATRCSCSRSAAARASAASRSSS